jgi:predicted neutral ceramidase superfamily lipid hydrolase
MLGTVVPAVLMGLAVVIRQATQIWRFRTVEALFEASVVAIVMAMPCAITMVARKRAFLWGILPLAVATAVLFGFFVFFARVSVVRSPVLMDALLIEAAIVWPISSGLGLLVRWLLRNRCAREARTSAPADEPAPEGVWPPPPRSGA